MLSMSPYEAQVLTEERIKDRRRAAEQARLVKQETNARPASAEGPGAQLRLIRRALSVFDAHADCANPPGFSPAKGGNLRARS